MVVPLALLLLLSAALGDPQDALNRTESLLSVVLRDRPSVLLLFDQTPVQRDGRSWMSALCAHFDCACRATPQHARVL
jgi:hypothetical protein